MAEPQAESAVGDLRKMAVHLAEPVRYELRVGERSLALNPWIGGTVRIRYLGTIHCVACGRVTAKSFNQGYCYPCFTSLAECDRCIVSPEKCHYHLGTCRDPEWGRAHCMQPHVVYLANSSGLKVGITRQTQVPTRWIDQGARQALAVYQVATRRDSGLLESTFKTTLADRTDWRAMLRGDPAPLDLAAEREQLAERYGPELAAAREQGVQAEAAEGTLVDIHYPVIEHPTKVRSLTLDKHPQVSGTLLGVKGQYLLLDSGVLNVRRHAGYAVEVSLAMADSQ